MQKPTLELSIILEELRRPDERQKAEGIEPAHLVYRAYEIIYGKPPDVTRPFEEVLQEVASAVGLMLSDDDDGG